LSSLVIAVNVLKTMMRQIYVF